MPLLDAIRDEIRQRESERAEHEAAIATVEEQLGELRAMEQTATRLAGGEQASSSKPPPLERQRCTEGRREARARRGALEACRHDAPASAGSGGTHAAR